MNPAEADKFSTKQKALAHYKEKYGSCMGKTLKFNAKYSGKMNVGYNCKHCTEFFLKITLKMKGDLQYWSLSRTSALEHKSKDPSTGFTIPCVGKVEGSISSITSNTVVTQVLNHNLPIKVIQNVAAALNINTSVDVIKKANKEFKISAQQHLDGYNLLEPYLHELKRLNPGLLYEIQRVPDSTAFLRLIVIPQYTKDVQQYQYPLLGLDAAHMKDIVLNQLSSTAPRRI